MTRFSIRFSDAARWMGVVGMTPSRCYVDVDDLHLRVRMGIWFELDAERGAVRTAELDHARVLGWGVHGWRGRWLVNGASTGMVRLTLEPPVRARMGPVPLRVRVLRVSVDAPDGLVAAFLPPAMPSDESPQAVDVGDDEPGTAAG